MGGYGSKSIYAISSNVGLLTQFSDPFNVQDPLSTITGVGRNWNWAIKSFSPYNSGDHAMGTPLIQNSSFDGATALTWKSQLAGAAAVWRSAMWPNKNGFYQNVYGKTQFVQATILKVTGNWNFSLMCNYYAGESNGLTGYHAALNGIGGAVGWQIRRSNIDVYTTLSANLAFSIPGNVVVRMSTDQSISGQVTVTLNIGGTIVSQVVDTSTNILTIGSPAIAILVPDNLGTGALEIRNFSCGTGV